MRAALCSLLVALGASPLAAQSSPTPELAAALRDGFAELSGWVTKGAAVIPADKYGYRPVGTVRTVGELLGHIADGYNYYCAQAAGKAPAWSDAVATGKTDKATITAKLAQATATCQAVYGPGKTQPPLVANIAHGNLHYGNLVTYIRMLGLVPPSS